MGWRSLVDVQTGRTPPGQCHNANHSAQTCFAVFAEFAIELSRQAELASVADALRDVAYIFSARTFSGRVAMVMGAKNMTMTEIQHARWIGDCSLRWAKF